MPSKPSCIYESITGREISCESALPYIAAQVLGSIAGAGVLYLIASGQADFDVSAGVVING